MNRRDAVLSLMALSAAPKSAFAQAAARVYRVAVVFHGSADSERVSLEALRQGLRLLGYPEGGNLKLEVAYAEGRTERAVALIQEAVARKPDVLVTHGSATATAAKKATSTLPVVMALIGDPVALGFAASLARPGGNFTGNTILDALFLPKSLEILHETFPAVRTFGVLTDPAMPAIQVAWPALEAAGRNLKLELDRSNASTPGEIDRVLSDLAKKRPGALLVVSMPLFMSHRKRMIESLAKSRIPQIWSAADATDLGALMSHAPTSADMWRNSASFVHRILQGAKPGDLPFEQATKFEFSINLKAAKALGIKIPQAVLLRADRVIE
jgi:putative ABC transport system substrate-binding protein